MATSIPPTGIVPPRIYESETETAVPPSAELFPPDFVPPGVDLTQPTILSSRTSEQRPEGYIVGGVMMLIMAMVFGAMGAPGVMVLGVVLFAIISFAWYFVAKQQQVDRYYRQQMEAQEAEERIENKVSEAMKDSLKKSIMVRCRYCGSLNDEEARKCDSCGATL